MPLTDNQESVEVTLHLTDWATVIVALSTADIPASTRERINTAIFERARETARVLI